MTRSTIETLKRVKTHLSQESKRMVKMQRPYHACKYARWAVALGDAIDANTELMTLKGEKVSWK